MKWMRRPGPNLCDWHRHFAWKPVQIADTDIMVWLEWVERMNYNGPDGRLPFWVYRFPRPRKPPLHHTERALRQSVVRMGDTTVRLPQK